MHGRRLDRQTLTIAGIVFAILVIVALGLENDRGLFGTAGDKTQTHTSPTPQAVVISLGDGELRVYAPTRLKVDELSEIRVEIQFRYPSPNATFIWNPPPTATPDYKVGTPQPTPTFLPLVNGGYVPFYPRMGVRLGGVDVENFRIEAAQQDNVLNMNPSAINWWKWAIKPIGENALGKNDLEITVYLPDDILSQLQFPPQFDPLRFSIEVESPVLEETSSQSDAKTNLQGTNTGQIVLYTGIIALAIFFVGTTALLTINYYWKKLTDKEVSPEEAAKAAARRFESSKLEVSPRQKLLLFISYSSEDKDFVSRLQSRLELHDFRVWRDKDSISPGDNWPRKIEEGLNECTHLLFILTPASIKSEYVAKELTFAIEKHKKIIPLKLEPCDLPLLVNDLQIIDFQGDYKNFDGNYWIPEYQTNAQGKAVLQEVEVNGKREEVKVVVRESKINQALDELIRYLDDYVEKMQAHSQGIN